jgi:two-component system, OmpR family, response regulator ChvI
LVVDDEKDISYVIKKALESSGFDVDAFSDPKEALSRFKPDTYRLLILDIRMPGMSGIQLLREIRKVDDMVKVLFMTAFEIQKKEWDMVMPSIEVHEFIKKPVSMHDLVKAVSEAI